MTRTYAARRLLEHGPLTFAELREITGWTHNQLRSAIYRLLERPAIEVEKRGRNNVYRLAHE